MLSQHAESARLGKSAPKAPWAEVQTYEEGVGCRAWILGKWMEPKRIQARLGFSRALALPRFWRAERTEGLTGRGWMRNYSLQGPPVFDPR